MKNPKIAQVLKYHRKLSQLSVQEVSDILKDHNIVAAPKTIYGWENGQTQPNADTLMVLCQLYHIEDALYTFGYKEKQEEPITLSKEEEQIIMACRKDEELRRVLIRLLNLS